MIPDAGVLNRILRAFNDQFLFGLGAITTDAQRLLALLAAIEIILVGLWWAYSGTEALGKLLKKTIFLCVFVGAVNNYGTLVALIKDSFVQAGTRAAGSQSPLIEDPSGIIDRGINVMGPLWTMAQNMFSNWDIFDGLFLFVVMLVTLVSYFIIALQVLMVRLEFGLISTLGLILVPLGVFKHTAFLAEKVLGAIISLGVKLMVLSFVLSIAFPIIEGLTIPENPGWFDQIYTVLAAVTVAVLSLHAPALASGLLTGSPTLTAGSVTGGAAIGAAAGTATFAPVAYGLVQAGKGAMHASRSGFSATKAAASAIWNGRDNPPPNSGSPTTGPSPRGGPSGTTVNSASTSSGSQTNTQNHAPPESNSYQSSDSKRNTSDQTTKGSGIWDAESSSGSPGNNNKGHSNNKDAADKTDSTKRALALEDGFGTENNEEKTGTESNKREDTKANPTPGPAEQNKTGEKEDKDKGATQAKTLRSSRLSNLITGYQVGSSVLHPTHPSGGTVLPINHRDED